MKTDICIIGAGPAGLSAAIGATENNSKPIIIETNTSACRKLLLTGAGRCNLTHQGSLDEFVRAYDKSGRFLKHNLYEFSADDLREYFEHHGLKTRVEKDGCVFPVTDKASDVADVMIKHAKDLSVNFMYDKKVVSIKKDKDCFVISTDTKKISSAAVIIATGGVSWPATGSTGSGYRFAQTLGHTIIEPRASLTPLVTAENWPGKIRGTALSNAAIKTSINGKKIHVCGAVIFTDKGIGGPAILELSRLITDSLPSHKDPVKITIDTAPQYSIEQLEQQIIQLCLEHPKKKVEGALTSIIPKSLASILCSMVSKQTIYAGSLLKGQRSELLRLLKQIPLRITSTGPIEKATVTRGGIARDEIDPRTMESKICPGLFLAGEVIDVDGPCGGFNLQIAFSTGQLAGKRAAEKYHT